MRPVLQLETIAQLHKLLHQPVQHPLISVVDFSSFDQRFDSGLTISVGFYVLMFKNYCANTAIYGRQPYDFEDGSLMCMAPRQAITLGDPVEGPAQPGGWGLFFHPDLIVGTALGRAIKSYTFFGYDVTETLHLSQKEKQILTECVQNIALELAQNIDRHSQPLMVSNLELLLNYCTRYYDRQFITRRQANHEVLAKVEEALNRYFQSSAEGLPTVKYLADQVCLSPSYLSDLLKRETGMNAQDRIHYHVIEEAKLLLLSSTKSVAELAYSLGFEYPQYFSRLFKAKTGLTPLEFRHQN